MPKFRTRFNVDEFEKPVSECNTPSLTQQHFKDECDINNIIARYQVTGVLGDPLDTRQPVYGDFSTVPEYLDAQNVIARAGEAFEALPAAVRKRFDNNPAVMLEFLQDESNREEAIKLGLVTVANSVTEHSNSNNVSTVANVDNSVDSKKDSKDM